MNLEHLHKEIERYAREVFSRKAAKVALDHIKENFRREGFMDGGLQKWKTPKRKKRKKGATDSQYKTLHSRRDNLLNSIRALPPEAGKATLTTDVEYAAIHNNGGEIIHPITRRQRAKAMETHIRKTGTKHRNRNSMWKGLAMSKRTSYTIQMPKRRFIGPSRELDEQLRNMVVKDITKLIQK